jgi:regulator of protease activity HflC (stomatin/prohibitin superfamily)
MTRAGQSFVAIIVLGIISLIGMFISWFAFMYTETVEPGHHGVIVDKPYFFGSSGVRPEPLREGRILLWRTSTMYTVRVTPTSENVKVDDFSSSDNILLDFESTIQYRVTDSVKLVDKFGEDWFNNNVLRQYLAIVREAVKKKSMSEMMSDVSAAQTVDNEVTQALVKHVVDQGLPIEILGVSLGRAKPNASVLEQMNATAAQQQRRRTLIEAEAAELQRKAEQIAKAQADNAYRNSMGLTPQQFMEIEINRRWAEACEKAANCIITPGNQVVNVK